MLRVLTYLIVSVMMAPVGRPMSTSIFTRLGNPEQEHGKEEAESSAEAQRATSRNPSGEPPVELVCAFSQFIKSHQDLLEVTQDKPVVLDTLSHKPPIPLLI